MTTGLSAFDRTVQESNIWLKHVQTQLGDSRPDALAALRATFHALRDRLPPQTALHLADQLPLLLRGVFVEGWSLSDKPSGEHSAAAFVRHVSQELPPKAPADGEAVVRAVFQTMRTQMDVGEIDKVLAHLPRPIRELWLEACV
jgi:uncharacterized protein (DUF2267 family)